VQGEAIAVHRPLVAEQFGRIGELKPGIRAWGAGIDRAQAHAHAGHALAFDQATEVVLGSVGNLDHAAILAKSLLRDHLVYTPDRAMFSQRFWSGESHERPGAAGTGPLHSAPWQGTRPRAGPARRTAAAGAGLGAGRERPGAATHLPVQGLPPHPGVRERAGLHRPPR